MGRFDIITNKSTYMHKEIHEIPAAISRLLQDSDKSIFSAAKALRDQNPNLIITIARGSSDHGASFLKYAIEILAGIPVASLGPSVNSIYGVNLKLDNAASLSISQSGASPDIIAATKMAKFSSPLTIALINQSNSLLGQTVDHEINIAAGPELSVAATKTFVSSIVAGLLLLAKWQQDDILLAALERLPNQIEQGLECDWSELASSLDLDRSLFVLGRGPTWSIASEVALKFQETCGIYAQAYSAAEVMHGPMALINKDFPVLALCARDSAYQSCVESSQKLAQYGASVFITAKDVKNSKALDFVATGHPLTDALCLVVPFYVFVESYARKLGLNPDKPPLLHKVTQTR